MTRPRARSLMAASGGRLAFIRGSTKGRRAVPLARRNLLADPRRLAVTAAGVGLAVTLILLLDGLWTGMRTGVTTYEDNVGADLYLAQAGTHNFYGSSSRVPRSTAEDARRAVGTEWAEPVRSFYAVVDLHGRKVPTSVIGSVPGRPGGAWGITAGRAPERDDEVTVGRALAERHGIDVGERLGILGRDFAVVGTGPDSFMTSFVFMTHAATDRLLAAPGTTSFVLVRTDRPAALRSRFEAAGLAVLEREELGRNDFQLLARAFQAPMRVITGVAFAVGGIMIALSTYTAVVERRREYGIIKAMGADVRYLSRVAFEQAALLACAGLAAGGAFFVAGRWLITVARPQFVVTVSWSTIGRAAGAALLMGALAAVVPARRLAALEPATAYRGG